MATGWLAWACLMLAAGQPNAAGSDVFYMKDRAFTIPVKVEKDREPDVKELVLYISTDQGKTWDIYDRATPTQKSFQFHAKTDGLFFFSIAVVDRRGKQDPADIATAKRISKIHIDSEKPEVKFESTKRVGNDIQLTWNIREANPNWSSLKLEYRSLETPNAPWTPLPVVQDSTRTHTFNPNTQGDVAVRISLADMAKNEAADEKIVAGTPVKTTVSASPVPGAGPGPNATVNPTAPLPNQIPGPMGNHGAMPVNHVERVPNDARTGLPDPRTPIPDQTLPPVQNPGQNPAAVGVAPPVNQRSEGPTPVYDTQPTRAPVRGPMPPVRVINKRAVKLGFDVGRIGPSGLGSVQVYVTTNDGASWEELKDNPAIQLPNSAESRLSGPLKGTVTVQLPKDGVVYGFYLVPVSRAGLSDQAPVSGDTPHARVESDVTQPAATLFGPATDQNRPGALLLTWQVTDRNIAANPITLEFSATPDGPWEVIGEPSMANTGRYTWIVPDKAPPKVFMRLTARDNAGNVAVATTPEAQLIDLSVPKLEKVTVQVGDR
jgi:hypothetical protein